MPTIKGWYLKEKNVWVMKNYDISARIEGNSRNWTAIIKDNEFGRFNWTYTDDSYTFVKGKLLRKMKFTASELGG